MKILISKEQFKAFCDTFDDPEYVKSYKESLFNDFTYEKEKLITAFKEMFDLDFMGDKSYKFAKKFGFFEKFSLVMDYTINKETAWKILMQKETAILISFSQNIYFYDSRFGTVIEEPNYDGLTLGEIHQKIGSAEQNLPAEMTAISLNSVKSKKSEMEEKQKELKKMKEDISYAQTTELAKLQEEINKMKEKLRKRKEELQAEIDEKLQQMNEQIEILNKQVYRMEAEIYMIRSYNGETLELQKVRS